MGSKIITSKNITKKQIKKVLHLIKSETRAEAMARHGEFGNTLGFADYYLDHIALKNELRKFLYGSDNLCELGERWGILESREKKKKNKTKSDKENRRNIMNRKKKKKKRQLF